MNLLPEDLKKQIRRDYLYRLGSLFFVLAGCIGLISLMLLYPSLEYSRGRVLSLEKQINEAFTPGTDSSNLREQNESLSKLTKLLLPEQKIQTSNVLRAIFEKVSNGIEIKSLDIRMSGDSSEIIFGGVSANRDSLKYFNEALASDERFKDVFIPLSSFARDKDLDFSLKFRMTNI